jgi:Fe-S-cluster containining protein
MTADLPNNNLANYRALLQRVDQLCGVISEQFADHIFCKAGCSSCCRHLTLFPVEAANLRVAFEKLPAEIMAILAGRIDWPENGSCPLLLADCCTVYADRPVICRTHGLPLLTEYNGKKSVDCCPENFITAAALPGSAVINLEALNSALVAINALFVSKTADLRFQGKDRFPIADIIVFSTDTEPQ